MHIPQNFINQLLDQTDIVELIKKRVDLKKKGKEYSACCPFHTEKTPSFTVSSTKQFFYCFGCGASGNAIQFLTQYDRLSFLEAIETLATQAGSTIPYEQNSHQTSVKNPQQPYLEKISQLYQQNLKKCANAINYLKQRHLSGETAKRFNLGYADDNWQQIWQTLKPNQEEQSFLDECGLLIGKEKTLDRFRNRLIFPIRNHQGKTIAFGGRTLGDEQPKYLNSPESNLFHKRRTLYGLYEAKQQNQQLETMIVTEGYMDVIALAQAGITYAVATLGTAITQEHIQLLTRHSSHIIFAFDGDNAGRKAAQKALETSLPLLREELNFHFLILPQGEDPDSLVQIEKKSGIEKRIKNSPNLIDFLLHTLNQKYNIDTAQGKANIAKQALKLLMTMPQGLYFQLLKDKIATHLNITLATLEKAHQESTPTARINTKPTHTSTYSHQLPTNGVILAILLHQPTLINEIPTQYITTPSLLHIVSNHLKANKTCSFNQLLHLIESPKQREQLTNLINHPLIKQQDEESQKSTLKQACKQLEKQYQRQLIEQLIEKAKQKPLSLEEKKQLQNLLHKNAP